MALKSIIQEAVGTDATQVDGYQVPGGNVSTVVGWFISNRINTAPIVVSAWVKRGARILYVVRNANLLVGGGVDINPGKIVLVAGDQLFVASSVAASLDTMISFSEDLV